MDVMPRNLAKAGLFYRGKNDHVECAFDKCHIFSWKSGDDAFSEHKNLFPECSFVQGKDVGNITIPERCQVLQSEASVS